MNLRLIPKEVLEIKRQERLIETGAIGSMLNNKRDRDNLIWNLSSLYYNKKIDREKEKLLL